MSAHVSHRVRQPLPRIEQLAIPLEADPVDEVLAQNYGLVEHLVDHRFAQKKKPSPETVRSDRIRWKVVCDYFLSQRIDVRFVTEHELRMFLATKDDCSERARAAYARLIDQVLTQTYQAMLETERAIARNVAAHEILRRDYAYADSRSRTSPPKSLTDKERARIETYLKFAPKEGDWKQARNWAYMALVFGCGAPVQVLRLLRSDEVVIDSTDGTIDCLSVRGTHRHPARQYPLNDSAKRSLSWWLRMRAVLPVERGRDPLRNEPADFVFPGTLTGSAMDRDTTASVCRGAFESLGIDARHAPVQILRTEFAKRQLEHQVDPDKISGHMGFYDARSLLPYKGIVRSSVAPARPSAR